MGSWGYVIWLGKRVRIVALYLDFLLAPMSCFSGATGMQRRDTILSISQDWVFGNTYARYLFDKRSTSVLVLLLFPNSIQLQNAIFVNPDISAEPKRLAPKLNPGKKDILLSPAGSTKTNAYKLFPSNQTIPIQIKLFNHSDQFLLLQAFAQFPSHPPQICQIDGAFSICIE